MIVWQDINWAGVGKGLLVAFWLIWAAWILKKALRGQTD